MHSLVDVAYLGLFIVCSSQTMGDVMQFYFSNSYVYVHVHVYIRILHANLSMFFFEFVSGIQHVYL